MADSRKMAQIASTFIGYDPAGILTAWLELRHDGGLARFDGGDLRRPAALGNWIAGVLLATKADSWSQLVGQSVRVILDDAGKPTHIGHAWEDSWFVTRTAYASL